MKFDAKKIHDSNNEAREIVDHWIRTHRQSPTGKSSGLKDKYRLLDDSELKEVFADIKTGPNAQAMITELFFGDASKQPIEASLYTPMVANMSLDYSKPVYLTWKVDDREAKTYNRFDDKDNPLPAEIHAEIVKAWKMEKARVKAQEAADALAAKIRTLAQKELRDANNPAAFDKGLSDLIEAGKYKALNSIVLAKLKQQPPPVNFQRQQMQEPLRYAPAPFNDKQFSYPPRDMADKWLGLRDKPAGEVLVQANVPKTHLYVGVFSSKQVPDINEFYTTVFSKMNLPPKQSMLANTLYYEFGREQAFIDFEKDFNERVKAETKFHETDDLKKQDTRSPVQSQE